MKSAELKKLLDQMKGMINTTPITKSKPLARWLELANVRIATLLQGEAKEDTWEVVGASTALHHKYEQKFGPWPFQDTNPANGEDPDFLISCEYRDERMGGRSISEMFLVRGCKHHSDAQACARGFFHWANDFTPEVREDMFTLRLVLRGYNLETFSVSGSAAPLTILN